MISALQHKSKYKSNSISNFFEEKNQIFGFPWCSTGEDLSIDVSITNVGLIFDEARVISALRQKLKLEFQTLTKKKSNFGVSML